MPKQKESKIVNFTKDQMFDLVADIDRYSEFLPWCNNSKIISKKIEDNQETVIAMLKLLGFEKTTVTYHDYRDKNGRKVFQWTVIGERTIPIDQCDYDFDPN